MSCTVSLRSLPATTRAHKALIREFNAEQRERASQAAAHEKAAIKRNTQVRRFPPPHHSSHTRFRSLVQPIDREESGDESRKEQVNLLTSIKIAFDVDDSSTGDDLRAVPERTFQKPQGRFVTKRRTAGFGETHIIRDKPTYIFAEDSDNCTSEALEEEESSEDSSDPGSVAEFVSEDEMGQSDPWDHYDATAGAPTESSCEAPGFDPTKITMEKLVKHDIEYASKAKKADLVGLFRAHVVTQRERIGEE
ncbi:hypothetical protein CONLIGDRAFT_681976 [Coniochaeta ligniaria NRRL 30616]|uniref:HeH/LEM domain-containing protein n=1 Tax=Coniochaeta ligniaria NRRL 30616 TaxID=1408157 RepID=A0A1J7JH45_9PEZI|nr:hypothetical protein CONLIGDRAFT_681976 [Coniochaeta ligniaria NRRL 30616]